MYVCSLFIMYVFISLVRYLVVRPPVFLCGRLYLFLILCRYLCIPFILIVNYSVISFFSYFVRYFFLSFFH